MTKIPNKTNKSTEEQIYTSMTHDETMALSKQQFLDRCKAWLDEFNGGKQLNIDNPNKCPIHVFIMHNHLNCGKDLVGGIVNCQICGNPMCPGCSNHEVMQLSRVTGYIQSVESWNSGKRQELKDRKRHDTFG